MDGGVLGAMHGDGGFINHASVMNILIDNRIEVILNLERCPQAYK